MNELHHRYAHTPTCVYEHSGYVIHIPAPGGKSPPPPPLSLSLYATGTTDLTVLHRGTCDGGSQFIAPPFPIYIPSLQNIPLQNGNSGSYYQQGPPPFPPYHGDRDYGYPPQQYASGPGPTPGLGMGPGPGPGPGPGGWDYYPDCMPFLRGGDRGMQRRPVGRFRGRGRGFIGRRGGFAQGAGGVGLERLRGSCATCIQDVGMVPCII